MEFLYTVTDGNHYLKDYLRGIPVKLLSRIVLGNGNYYLLFIDKNRPILYVGVNMSPMTLDYKVVKIVAMGLTPLSKILLSANFSELSQDLEFKVGVTKDVLIKSNVEKEGTNNAFFIKLKNNSIFNNAWFPIPDGCNDKYFKAFNHLNKKPIIGVNLKDELVEIETIPVENLSKFKVHNVSIVGSYEIDSKKIKIAGNTYRYSCVEESNVPTSYIVMSTGTKYKNDDISVLKFCNDVTTSYITKIVCCGDEEESYVSATNKKTYLYANMNDNEIVDGAIRMIEKPLTKLQNLTDLSGGCYTHVVNQKSSKGFDIEVIDEPENNNIWFGCVNHSVAVSLTKDVGVNITRDAIVSVIQDHGNGYMLIITKHRQGDMFKYQLTRIKTIVKVDNLIDFKICKYQLGVFNKSKKIWLEHSIDSLDYILIHVE